MTREPLSLTQTTNAERTERSNSQKWKPERIMKTLIWLWKLAARVFLHSAPLFYIALKNKIACNRINQLVLNIEKSDWRYSKSPLLRGNTFGYSILLEENKSLFYLSEHSLSRRADWSQLYAPYPENGWVHSLNMYLSKHCRSRIRNANPLTERNCGTSQDLFARGSNSIH